MATLPWSSSRGTGIGSLPGTDSLEAARVVAGECSDFIHLHELPGRGPGADMIGRTGGMLSAVSQEFSIETITQGERAQQIVVEKSRRINPPTFTTFGSCAMFRNSWIVQDSEITVAFQHNGSRGTARAIRVAREFGRQVFVYD